MLQYFESDPLCLGTTLLSENVAGHWWLSQEFNVMTKIVLLKMVGLERGTWVDDEWYVCFSLKPVII